MVVEEVFKFVGNTQNMKKILSALFLTTLLLPETVGRELHSLGDDPAAEAAGKQQSPVEQDAAGATNTVG